MKLNVIFKVYLNNRNKLGQFEKTIAKVCSKEENVFLQLTSYRMGSIEADVRYVVGHIKEEELNDYILI